MPQLVMGASACALMLRLSMVSMQGASGLARDTYQFVAVSLTLASVCTALAQISQVCLLLSPPMQHGCHLLVYCPVIQNVFFCVPRSIVLRSMVYWLVFQGVLSCVCSKA